MRRARKFRTVANLRAALARFERIVDVLRTCHIRDGWSFDDASAEKARAYLRRQVAKPETATNKGLEDLVAFAERYNQSLDYIFVGDERGMIAVLAAASPHPKRRAQS